MADPILPPPASGKTTSEYGMTRLAVVLGALCAILPPLLEAFTAAKIEGKGWLAAIAASLIAGAAAYTASRGKVKAAHVAAEGRALRHLAEASPQDKAAALERLAAGDDPLPDAE